MKEKCLLVIALLFAFHGNCYSSGIDTGTNINSSINETWRHGEGDAPFKSLGQWWPKGTVPVYNPITSVISSAIRPSEQPPHLLPRDKSGRCMVKNHAVSIPYGYFLLVYHQYKYYALRVIEHTRYQTKSGKTVPGARIEYYVSVVGRFGHFQRQVGEVATDYDEQRLFYLELPNLKIDGSKRQKLRIEWSTGDHFYAPDDGPQENIVVALTEWTKIDQVDAKDPRLKWYYLQKPIRYIEKK